MRSLIPAVGIAVAAISFAAAASDLQEESADLLKQARAQQRELAASGVSAADVGDADSFGRNAQFLGVAQTGTVSLQADCTPDPKNPPGPDDRCVVIAAPPSNTSVAARDIGRIKLPAKATHSILCHAVTSFPFWQFHNTTGSAASNAQFSYAASFTIDNAVLNDPNLIDPTTGNPFNGSLEVIFGSLTSENRTLQPGERTSKRHIDTRFCIGGLISRAALIGTYKLTDAQADTFFKKPITIHLNIALITRYVDNAVAFFGLRLFGDGGSTRSREHSDEDR
jgi:hypothetical protein